MGEEKEAEKPQCTCMPTEIIEKKFGKFCDYRTGKLPASWDSMLQITPHGNDEILEISKKYTNGAICGSEMDRNTLLNSFFREFGKDIHCCGNNHDGVVSENSCRAVKSDANWSKDSSSNFWLAEHNHNEIIGRSGKENPDVIKWLHRMLVNGPNEQVETNESIQKSDNITTCKDNMLLDQKNEN